MIKAQIDVKWYGDNIIKDVEHTADMVLEGACIIIQQQARLHTEPGRGPGPHPHRTPHVDTGNLMASIEVGDLYKEGNALVREVGNTEQAPYGKFLEIGWTSRAGNWFRYPWLFPALEISVGPIRKMVQGIRL